MKRSIRMGLVALGLGTSAHAGFDAGAVENGAFEAGDTGWTLSVPNGFWFIEVSPTGGNPDGYASIVSPFGNSEGVGCFEQTVTCALPGAESLCEFSVDYRLEGLDAAPLTGRVRVFLDGESVFVTDPSDFIDWTTIMFTTTCGEHELRLCLEVDPGNNGYRGCFDNVSAHCLNATPVTPATWGRIKSVYR